MQGLDVENKDWVSHRIPSTVNLLLLVSQWKCAHFGRQWKLKVTCGKTQVLKLFLHGRCWKTVSVQKAAIMTWSFANCSRQGLPGKKGKKQTLLEMKRWPLYWQRRMAFPPVVPPSWSLRVFGLWLFYVSNLGILIKVELWLRLYAERKLFHTMVSLCKYHKRVFLTRRKFSEPFIYVGIIFFN